MEPIIRAAPVSPTSRRVGRPTAPPVPQVRVTMDEAELPQLAKPVEQAAMAVPATYRDELCERDAIIETLRRDAEKRAAELSQAQADAERRGYQAGEKKGEAAALETCEAQAARVKALVAELSASRGELLQKNQDAIVDVVFAALCRMIGQAGASLETVRSIVADVTAETREREQLVVRLHPADAALFGDCERNGRITGDPSVKLGGCIIDGPNGSLDARFETQLELLGVALKAARSANGKGA